ncbi:MAG: hypothetical protein RIR59_1176 [Pseudomonadota bacterium]
MDGGITPWIISVRDELLLFATCGFVLGGLGDLAIDAIWLRRLLIQKLRPPASMVRSLNDLPEPAIPPRIAVFVPAWREHAVISDMLSTALNLWAGQNFQIFVGCYPNDPQTMAVVLGLGAPEIRLVIAPHAGPTTKADCLNSIYAAMQSDEARRGMRFNAVLLHDAEDLVHADELALCRRLTNQYALIQMPVLPMQTRGSPWISGHYRDEFAEAHSRDLVVRGHIGASLPSAGVGCCLSRDALAALTDQREGQPFAHDSVTEDYELGLRLADFGARAAFVRIGAASTRGLIATRAHFPGHLNAAIRQKARWTLGIALDGWDRLGWRPNLVENWMRLRDRRAPLAAVIIVCGYSALLLTVLLMIVQPKTAFQVPSAGLFLIITQYLLLWRLLIRSLCVRHHYGWMEGLLAIPRTLTSNVVAVLAARRAVSLYLHMRRTGKITWEKTAHRSPLEP